jgi:hypothetical protein
MDSAKKNVMEYCGGVVAVVTAPIIATATSHNACLHTTLSSDVLQMLHHSSVD